MALITAGLLLAGCRTAQFSPVQECLTGPDTATALQPPVPASEVLVAFHEPAGLLAQGAGQLRQLQARGVGASFGLQSVEQRQGVLPDVFRVQGDATAVAAELAADPRVAWAVPNYSLQLLETDCHNDQWNLSGFGVPAAWGDGPGRHQVTVAVIDSGIDVDHPELSEAILPGFNFHDMTADPRPGTPVDSHGTHVTGIIAARGLQQVTGVAGFPDTIRVVPIRIFDDTGASAELDDLLLALAWAAGHDLRLPGVPVNRHPAQLVNLSLGAPGAPNPGVTDAIQAMVGNGITVVAASGNVPSAGIHIPANSPAALAIGSVDSDFHRSSFSSFGGPGELTVMAPGGLGPSPCGRVLSTIPADHGVGCAAGTSMAAPFVTGSLALLLSHEPQLSPAQLEARLRAATYFDADFMTDEQYGAGVLCTDRLISGSNAQPHSPC